LVLHALNNFAVHAPYADKVELCLFDGEIEERVLLAPDDGGRHVARVSGVSSGQRYGYRVHGPWRPDEGLWCNPAKLLMDPYARLLTGTVTDSEVLVAGQVEPDPRDSAPFTVRSVVADDAFDWGREERLHHPWDRTIIYETHVKGMSVRHPDVPAELRGTYGGLTSEPILDHLASLGVTALDLMPIHFAVTEPAVASRGLTNYWGYSTLGYFAPDPRFAAGEDPVREFKQMVKALHERGIEVILDVVYNHTAEGNEGGPMLAFRGFDNPGFYRLDPYDRRRYLDSTGTGNSVDLTQPWARRLVLESLRYWVREMHVDGFRFDLAAALGRNPDHFDAEAPFMQELVADADLASCKLIAEPWDLGAHGYQLGNFPPPFRELNGRYRDTMREVWRGTPGTIDEFADRLTGSSGLFGRRGPTASINFITNHDGFTLADLVTYDVKHNEANGEENGDGESNNRSWNSGTEGPSDNAEIVELRERRVGSFLATLLLSHGVPMLLGGDELGRTQRGNNNAYCQDNEVSWFEWENADWARSELTGTIARLRREHPVLRRPTYPSGEVASNGLPDFGWFTPSGEIMTASDWETSWVRTLGVFWNGSAVEPRDESFYLIMNASTEPTRFHLPDMLEEWSWHEVVSTGPSQADDPNPTLLPFSLALYRTR
jgi:glycogen operon protein